MNAALDLTNYHTKKRTTNVVLLNLILYHHV